MSDDVKSTIVMYVFLAAIVIGVLLAARTGLG